MALDSANVDVAVSGGVFFDATSAVAPTDATTALPANWRDVGYISEDGVVETRDRSTNNIIAWQNADTVRTVVTESSLTIQFVMIETNPNSVELYYGVPVDDTDGSVEIIPATTGGRRSMVLQYVDGTKWNRMHVPIAEQVEVGELTWVSGEAVSYDVTMGGYPAPVGYSAKKWWNDLIVP
jgi:hypothetical protein